MQGNKVKIILTPIVILIFLGILFWHEQKEQLAEIKLMPNEAQPALNKNPQTIEGDDEISFQQLVSRSYTAPALTKGSVITKTEKYTKYNAVYQSDDLEISGVLYIPNSSAPTEGYPVLVTNHGYIDTRVYTTGRGLKREQEYFASRGYVVFHPDYRNHASSSKTENDPVEDRLGYITDIIHAVESLKASDIAINKNNITLLGHSMGGGATLGAAVVKPDIATRIVLYAPVTLNYTDSYNRYQKSDPDRSENIISKYGTPEDNSEFWEGLNGEPFLSRLTVPIQIYHGTSDQDVPYEWSTGTLVLLQAAGKQAELITYQGEGHEFSFEWEKFMQGVEQFTKNTSLE